MTSILGAGGALCGAQLSGPSLNSTSDVAEAFCGGAVCTVGLRVYLCLCVCALFGLCVPIPDYPKFMFSAAG